MTLAVNVGQRRDDEPRGYRGKREIECGDKRRFAYEQRAVEAAQSMQRSRHWDRKPVEAYRCSWCDWWHTGHPPAPDAIANYKATVNSKRPTTT